MFDAAYGPFSELVTLQGAQKNVSLAIKEGKVAAIGSADDLGRRSKIYIETQGPAVCLPGFIDAHTHMLWAGSRVDEYARKLAGATYQDIAKSGGGIASTVRATRAASDSDLRGLLAKRLHRHAQHGVTTVEVKTGYGLSVQEELRHLSLLASFDVVPTCLAAHTLPFDATDKISYLTRLTQELLPVLAAKKLAKRIDIFVDDAGFSPDLAKPYLQAAKKLGLSLVIHGEQFSVGGAYLAAELGAVSCDHLEIIGDVGIAALKKGGVIPVVLPGASLGLGLPFAPARKILDAGLPLVIASDWNPGSAPQGELLAQAAILGAYEKLSMEETLLAITLNAARALQLQDRGHLAIGMRADFQVYEASDWRDVFYYQGSLKPSTVYKAGVSLASTI